MNKKSKIVKKNFIIFLSLLLIFSIVPFPSAQAAGLATSFPVSPSDGNLSSTTSTSTNPQIIVSGNNVFVVWEEETDNTIRFASSSDDGTNYATSSEIGDATSGTSGFPQLSSSNNDVYVVWVDADGGQDKIKFILGDNDGQDFLGGAVTLSSNTSSSPKIASSTTDDVYVTWFEETNNDVLFIASNNAGDSFNAEIKIGDTNSFAAAPGIATSSDGANVYIVWQEDLTGTGKIKIARSTDSGVSFASPTTPSDGSLGGAGFGHNSEPQIAVSGNNVYVVWQDNSNIRFAASTDGGANFSDSSTPIGSSGANTKANAQIAADGSNVYVTWTKITSGQTDIMILRSTDSGSNFVDPSTPSDGNLSDIANESADPQLAVSGSNVFVTWRDISSGGGDDIFVIASSDNADTFDSKINLSNTDGIDSETPMISSTGSTSHVVWSDFSPGIFDIFTKSASISSTTVVFDASNYKLSDTATITITELSSSGAGTLGPVTITSSTGDTGGISLTFNEDGNSLGTFQSSITFSEDSESDQSTKVLKANTGDTITASFGSNQGSSSIFLRTIFVNGDVPISVQRGDIHTVSVNDMNSNLDIALKETITVIVTSNAEPSGISLVLTETGVNTGIFGGSDASPEPALIFHQNTGLIPLGSSVTITEGDTRKPGTPNASNSDALTIQTITVTVTSTSSPSGIELMLTETSANSILFEGTMTISSSPTDAASKNLNAVEGDFIRIEGQDPNSIERGIVTPNPNTANGALQVLISDTVTFTYKSESPSTIVTDDFSGGGGGGGLVRPSLVVNALGGLAGGGSAYSSPVLQLSNLVKLGLLDVPLEIEQMIYDHDSSIPISPMSLGFFENFDYPLVINDKGFVLSGFSTTLETQTLEINTPHTIKFMFYESDKIQHFSLYTNLRDANTAIHQSDTQIQYNDGQEIQVIDPNGFFKDVTFTLNELDGLKKEIVLEIIFAKEMATTDIIVRAWDPVLNSFDTFILDAIKVESSGIIESPIPTYEEPVIEELQSTSIPKWIKSNASWWSEQQISDSDFVSGIEYLIKNGIINVPGVEVGTSSATTEIPDWIKNNAGWWADSLITDGDFIEGIQWLIANGVIQL